MPKKIALDYDGTELRIVVANCSGSRVQVNDAQVISIADGESVSEKLRAFVTANELQKQETLVAIGRGKAELRELQLPPVGDAELPDMVRFQAIRNFAQSSDKAVVDYLVTRRTADNNTLIAAAVSPGSLDAIKELCGTSDLVPKRVALRPLAAAAMYLRQSKPPEICVLIDLLTDDAEIVVARAGKVIFVRTVRLPEGDNRSKSIPIELRRTMIACGESSTPDRIVVWGNASVHADDVAAIRESIGIEDVQAVSPFDLVDVRLDQGSLPEHVGRLAPLVGLLACDEAAPDTLIDFLNPRKRPEEKPDRVRQALRIGVPLAAVLLLCFMVYRNFADWDRKIASLNDAVSQLKEPSDAADESIARTERIDKFMDSDVNWLDEFKRFAENAPPSDKMIVETIIATADTREGGGSIRVAGRVTDPDVIKEMEVALRDETHSIDGKGTRESKDGGRYRWEFTETIGVSAANLRNLRYERMAAAEQSEAEQSEAEQSEAEQSSEADNADSDNAEGDDSESEDAASDASAEGESGADEAGEVTESQADAAELEAAGAEGPAETAEPTPESAAPSNQDNETTDESPAEADPAPEDSESPSGEVST